MQNLKDSLKDVINEQNKQSITIDGLTRKQFIEGNSQLFYRMITTMNDVQLAEFINVKEDDTFGLWSRLLDKHESQSKANVRQMLLALLNMKQEQKPIGLFIANLEELAVRVEVTVADNAINVIQLLAMMQLIHGMNEKYSQFKYALTLDDRMSTFAACKDKVLEQLEREELENKYHDQRNQTVLQVKLDGKETRSCNHCKKIGHLEKNCWIKHPELNTRTNSSSKGVVNKAAIKVEATTTKTTKAIKKAAKLQLAVSKAVESYKASQVKDDSAKLWHVKIHNINQKINAIKSGYIEFVADSSADVSIKKGDGQGLDNFDPNHKINIELADQSVIQSSGMGCIAGKINDIHVVPQCGANLLSIYQLYSEGKAILFHPTAGILIANSDKMNVSCTDFLCKGYVDGRNFKFQIKLNDQQIFKIQTINNNLSDKNEQLCQLQLQRLGFASPQRILIANKNKDCKLSLPINVALSMFHTEESDPYQLGKEGTSKFWWSKIF